MRSSDVLKFLALTLLLLSPCGIQAQEETPAPLPTVEVVNSDADDDAIAQRLREIFKNLDGLESIQISVEAGVITLSGEVASSQLREKAVTTAKRIEGTVEINDELTESRDVQQRLLPTLAKIQGYIINFISYLPLLVVAFAVVAALWLLGRFIAAREALFRKITPNPFLRELLQQFVKVAFVILGVVLALDILDATKAVGTVLGAAGLLSLAVSFALRDTVENYITSIMLSTRQPFAPNDHVIIEGHEGQVARLTSRATILMTFEGNHIRIPNATVFKSTIINYSRNPKRRFEFAMGVAPDSDLLQAQQIVIRTLQDIPGVLQDPPINCIISGVGDSTVTLQIMAWIDQKQTDFSKAKSEAIRLVLRAFEAANISVPNPSYQVKLIHPNQDKPVKAPVKTTAKEEILDTSATTHLEKQVEQDRLQADTDNLLDTNAPQE